MPPRSPLPPRFGLDPAWMRTPDRVTPASMRAAGGDAALHAPWSTTSLHAPWSTTSSHAPWSTMGEWIEHKIGEFIDVNAYFAEQRFVYQSGEAVGASDPYRANTFVWFHRDFKPEIEVPGEINIVYQDERIVIVDKPPFLASIPRGRHVLQSVVVKMRAQLGLPDLTPAHRLDRLTSGLLLLTTEKKWRGAYQSLFQNREVQKTYRALAPRSDVLLKPVFVENHLYKKAGALRVQELPGLAPNALSEITLERAVPSPEPGSTKTKAAELAVYHLVPHTGKTHQLRQHMMTLGVPIVGDPLYPDVHERAADDFTTPLQLLAKSLEFIDPVDETPRHYDSGRALPIVV